MIKVSRWMGHWAVVSGWLMVGGSLAGCSTGNSNSKVIGATDPSGTQFASVAPRSASNSPASSVPGPDGIDSLHVGDNLTITLSDMPTTQLPIEERIKEDGTITLLQNQTFSAAGKTRGHLEKEIRERYVPRFYLTMTVSVRQQKDTQFYYVMGEVKTPNREIYISRITVLQAIASANGFTDFARKKKVMLTRADGRKFTINCIKALKDPTLDLEVFPGDHINVVRRNPLW